MAVIDSQLAHQIHAFRTARGWNQTQLAQHLTKRRGWSVTQSQVSLWETYGRFTESNARFLRRVTAKPEIQAKAI